MGEKELENQLMETGTKLLEPPSSVEELLSLLDVGSCVEIGIPMLILFIAFSQYLKHFRAKALARRLERIKIPYPLQWGAPTFDAGHAFGVMAAVFVSLIEAALRLASATPPPSHVLSRGIGWQVYCGQTQAIQQYALELSSACLQPQKPPA
ncbi:hypothetical protein IFM89_025993 [Coptis chinensis]|uniref:Uncharacterized protein n=1 Tax=Coptis chinensis TaxID=261450 RepID=A0A835MJ80_9MAGN|nr:hypothetical protein IFM89_025993 [Coptis chinensis]